MPNPLLIGGAAATGVGLARAFGKKRRTPNIDVTGLQRAITQGSDEQKRIIGGLSPNLQGVSDDFTSRISEALTKAQSAGKAGRQTFLKDVGQITAEKGKKGADLRKQAALENLPELQQLILESQAATGGVQRGSTQAQFGKLAQRQGAEVARGVAQVELEQLAANQRARELVFQADERELSQVLGIDVNTAQLLLQSGRADLIQEAAQLLEESRNRTANQLGIAQIQANQQFAQGAVNQQRDDALTNALIGAGTNLIGFGAGGGFGGVPQAPGVQQIGASTTAPTPLPGLRRNPGSTFLPPSLSL